MFLTSTVLRLTSKPLTYIEPLSLQNAPEINFIIELLPDWFGPTIANFVPFSIPKVKSANKVFENFRALKSNPELPLQLAEEMGCDVEKLKVDANSTAITSLIDEEINQMKNSGIPRMSVPKFLINGKEPQGRSLEAWSAMIDDELKKINSKK